MLVITVGNCNTFPWSEGSIIYDVVTDDVFVDIPYHGVTVILVIRHAFKTFFPTFGRKAANCSKGCSTVYCKSGHCADKILVAMTFLFVFSIVARNEKTGFKSNSKIILLLKCLALLVLEYFPQSLLLRFFRFVYLVV